MEEDTFARARRFLKERRLEEHGFTAKIIVVKDPPEAPEKTA